MEERKHKKKLKEIVSFSIILFLVLLVSNIFSFNAQAEIPVQSLDDYDDSISTIKVDLQDDGPIQKDLGTLSAGSWIPISARYGHPMFPDKLVIQFATIEFLNDFTDAAGRYKLISPSGLAYEMDVTIDIYHFQFKLGPHFYLVVFDDPFWYVPVFAQQGSWRVETYIWDSLIFIERNIHLVSFNFRVAESTIQDQLTAPLYIYFGGFTFGWGAFGLIIPCFLLLLLIPVWVFAMVMLVRSYIGWGKLFSKEISRYSKNKTKSNGGIFKNAGKKSEVGYYR